MKKLLQLSERLRILLGSAVLCLGLAFSWILLGPDELSLFVILPFIGFYAWICPELWKGK